MWSLRNDTRFAAERSWVRDMNGAEVWLVAVKGTFSIEPDGTTVPADAQEAVCMAPEYAGELGRSSLLRESDLVPSKPTTDVLLRGRAYAPGALPARQVDVTMKVAGITKTLRIFGDRRWRRAVAGLSPSEPEPFVSMPIVYERAFGGRDLSSADAAKHDWERRNPVGTGFAVDPRHLVDQSLPNVEDPRELITSWNQRPAPAGFGPIARDWLPRLALAGTYDEAWEASRSPLPPLDLDERFYQCAPEDQQAPRYLRGGEAVELFNLTPNGSLRFCLPRVSIGFLTRLAGEPRAHPARLHTVLIEPDERRVTMVWHTALPCHREAYELELTRIFEKKRIGRSAEE